MLRTIGAQIRNATAIAMALWAGGGIGPQRAGAQTLPPPAEAGSAGDSLPPGTVIPAGPESSPANVPVGAAPISVQSPEKKKAGKGDLIIAPVPFSNPTIGTGLGLGVGYIFRPNKNDLISPPSTVLIGGLGSSNGTKGLFAGGNFYLSEDRYRVLFGLAHVDARYDFYGIGTKNADNDAKVPLGQKVDGIIVQALTRVAPKFYAGVRYIGGKSDVTIRGNQDSPIAEELAKLNLKTDISDIGLRLLGDTRNSTFFPTQGLEADFKADFHDPKWGDDFSYQTYAVAYRQYIGVGPNAKAVNGARQVVALQGYVRALSGNAPFFALSSIGAQDGLRGYVTGKYRDKNMLSLQGEYRQMLANRFGFVAFAGGSGVFHDFGEISGNNFVGSVGVGVRYQLSKENPVNYRIDYAYGKDGGNLYFSVGEAF